MIIKILLLLFAHDFITANTDVTKAEDRQSIDKLDLDTSDTYSNFNYAKPDTARNGNFGSVTGRQVPQHASNQPGLAVPNVQQRPGPGVNMPQIVGIDVQCSKQSMLVRVRFNVPFNGVIYAKGHYRNPDCRYVRVNGGQAAYEFTVQHDRCGTTFTDNFGQAGGQAYLENTLIIQMEAGIQEVWDAARRIRCLWNGLFQKTVSSGLNVDMLDVVSITYSGDAVDTYMDIQVGQGPNAPPATGLVKIGETLTVVVYVLGSNDLDVHVRECFAFSSDRSYSIQLTDSDGCVIKKKLMGPWLKTTQTGSSGASILSYSFLQAFKFPDTMDVNLECNVIICKYKCQTQCPYANNPNGQRVKRETTSNTTTSNGNPNPAVTLVRTIRVLSPDDIPISVGGGGNDSSVTLRTAEEGLLPVTVATGTGNVCMSSANLIIALVVVIVIMVVSCVLTAVLCIRIRSMPTSGAILKSAGNTTRRSFTPTPLLCSSTSRA